MKKKCIINYSSGGWYPKGGERLKNRLKELEFDGETIIAINKLPVFCKPHSEVPYMFKPYMFLLALDLGFEQVIWMDSAIYPVKKIDPLFDILENTGHLILLNGWTTGEWCADSALEPLGITREESFNIPHAMANVLGFDFTNKESLDVFYKYLHGAEKTFPGPWNNDSNKASIDNRVLGHRHDQTAISVLAYKAGWRFTPTEENNIICYGQNENFILNAYPA